MNTITCPICQQQFKMLNNKHLRSHGYSFEQFFSEFPNHPIDTPELRITYGSQSSEARQKIKTIQHHKKHIREINYLEKPNKCKQCDTIIPYKIKNNEFCTRSCSATYNNKIREYTYSDQAKINLSKNGSKMAPLNGKSFCYINYKNCLVCETIFIVNYKNKNRKLCHNPECRSKWHSEHNFKQNKTSGKCGYFKGTWCASSWELAFVAFHDLQGITVERCSISIPYHINKKLKRYFPDFKIGTQLYEIKGRITDDTYIKLKAASDKNIHIILLVRNDIIPMIKYVKKSYKIKDIIQLYQMG